MGKEEFIGSKRNLTKKGGVKLINLYDDGKKPFIRKVPGFRSGKWWKMMIASLFYSFWVYVFVHMAAEFNVEQQTIAKSAPPKQVEPAKPKTADPIEVYVMSQEFVEQRLKSPSTAKFPTHSKEMVGYLGDNRYQVISYVDSQNSYGAVLRARYVCILIDAGNNKWILENIEIK